MKSRLAFFLLIFVAFLDYVGVGLVYPLFAYLLFDAEVPLMAADASGATRGMWMGILIALTPFFQFFFSPILGSLSDQKGRKPTILFGLSMGVIGYLLAVIGVLQNSLLLLILYRAFFGISTATMTVIQASLVDISIPEMKARNFGIYNMALGVGFTVGPFLGGILCDGNIVSWFNYSTPFLVGALVTGINLCLLSWIFVETRKNTGDQPVDIFRGLRQAKLAFKHPTLKFAFLAFFLYLFGWDLFEEFISVTLIKNFAFSTAQVGYFFAYLGILYAFFGGLLTSVLAKRFTSKRLLLFSMMSGGIYLFMFLFIKNPSYFWVYCPGLIFIIALFYPVASIYVSDSASEDQQGEVMGVYHSVQALALILSPLIAGGLIGSRPLMPIYFGATLMILGGLIFCFNYLRERQASESFDDTV